MITRKLGNYTLDVIEIEYFKDYYYENRNKFSGVALNSFLKTLDIPPKFFKEQPEETQKELLENREVFVREKKKYLDKVIVVVKANEDILNACRLDKFEEELKYNKLKAIEDIPDRFEHRSFIKDGYISYVISDKIENGKDNNVLVIDFPILMNKKPVIHEARYTLPNETFATPVEHIHYLSSEEIEYEDYENIKGAIDERIGYLEEENIIEEDEQILRDNDVVSLALVEEGIIPKASRDKVESYLNEHAPEGLTCKKLESLILDFDEEFRSYKQVTNLRSINGWNIKEVLGSDKFREYVEELEKLAADILEKAEVL